MACIKCGNLLPTQRFDLQYRRMLPWRNASLHQPPFYARRKPPARSAAVPLKKARSSSLGWEARAKAQRIATSSSSVRVGAAVPPRSGCVRYWKACGRVFSALYAIYRLVDPLPPRHLIIAASTAGSGYDNVAKRYASILARHGVELEIRHSAGAVEDLKSLAGSSVWRSGSVHDVRLHPTGRHGHPLFAGRDIRRSDIHFLQAR